MNRTGIAALAASLLGFLLGTPAVADDAGVLTASAAILPDGRFHADRIVVVKSERKLHLMKGDEVMRSYDVSLGRNPTGPKIEEGDLRTPEGRYIIDWRNPNSDFFMSLHVSYPNTRDLARSRAQGVHPGGNIMIHGQPNDSEPTLHDYLDDDWTDGCVAVSNSAMMEIWLSVEDFTPIDIRP